MLITTCHSVFQKSYKLQLNINSALNFVRNTFKCHQVHICKHIVDFKSFNVESSNVTKSGFR